MKTSFAGKRDKRGDWRPDEVIQYAPVLAWPPRPMDVLRWLFGYPGFFLPWGIVYMAIPVVTWIWLTPAMDGLFTGPASERRTAEGASRWAVKWAG